MNRKEFIEKFSILSFGLATIPKLYANNLNRNEIPGLKSDINGILDFGIRLRITTNPSSLNFFKL